MSSFLYQGFWSDLFAGKHVLGTHTYKALIINGAPPAKDLAAPKRSDVSNEVVGAGYTAGGKAITLSVTRDDATSKIFVSFSDPSWPAASISGTGLIVYNAHGGAANLDELVGHLDAGGTVISTNDTWTFDVTAPLTINNPSA